MRTAKEIKEQIKLCKELREVIPQMSFFGDDNWSALNCEINVLKKIIKKNYDQYDIEKILEIVLDGTCGDELINNPIVRVCGWILGNTDSPLADEDSIECFRDKNKTVKSKKIKRKGN